MRKDGAIDYVELPGRNMAATRHFYRAAFGWEFQQFGPDYCAFSEAGLDGGFDSTLEGGQAHPLVILYAHDLGAMRKQVESAGGQVVKELTFPGGRRFHFRDPAGNILAVWSER